MRNGPAWAQTLLIVTYDEHGGLFDHVPPRWGDAADSNSGEFGFDFTRFGAACAGGAGLPADLPGTVFRPGGSTPLDHTSILKTLENRYGIPPLTARDAAAPDVAAVLTLRTPRTDDWDLSRFVPPSP